MPAASTASIMSIPDMHDKITIKNSNPQALIYMKEMLPQHPANISRRIID